MMAGMTTLILTGLLRVLKTRRALVLENLALRHQLAVLQRAAPRPRLRPRTVRVLGRGVPPAPGGPLSGTVESVDDCRPLPLAGAAHDAFRMGQSLPVPSIYSIRLEKSASKTLNRRSV